jgi:hypothetical protein
MRFHPPIAPSNPNHQRRVARTAKRTPLQPPASLSDTGAFKAQVVALQPQLQVQLQPSGEIAQVVPSASLLLQPQVGDQLLLVNCAGQTWALAVLERNPSSPAHLTVSQASSVSLSHPRLKLDAPAQLKVQTHALDVQAQTAQTRIGLLRMTVQSAKLAARRLSLWADIVQTHAHAILTSAEQRVTQVAQSDVLQAKQVIVKADQLMQHRARHIQIKAQESTVIDGKNILMG